MDNLIELIFVTINKLDIFGTTARLCGLDLFSEESFDNFDVFFELEEREKCSELFESCEQEELDTYNDLREFEVPGKSSIFTVNGDSGWLGGLIVPEGRLSNFSTVKLIDTLAKLFRLLFEPNLKKFFIF
jgi:hypothetical protein